MAKPISTRLKGLRRTETHLIKTKNLAQGEVATTREAVEAAMQEYEEPQKTLSVAEDEVAAIQEQVMQATLENADYDDEAGSASVEHSGGTLRNRRPMWK